jgi:DNA replication and repair protein RecF
LNYRNLSDVSLEFSPKINIFLGRNGQGKTNLLEALSYLAMGRSHRGAKDRELIRFGSDHLHLKVEGRDREGEDFTLEAALTTQGKKRIKIDGSTITRNAELVGRLSAVLFHPDEIALAKGGPEHRRRFLDLTLSVVASSYFQNLIGYRRALAQKNRLLKDRQLVSERELEVWDAELVQYGTPVILLRRQLLSALEGACQRAYSALAPDGGRLKMELTPSFRPLQSLKDQDDESAFWRKEFLRALGEGRARERRLGFAQIGPHRDRLELRLSGRALRRFGSQGEMRSAAIALKLGQAALIFERTKKRPVVLLDDIFSELDQQRTRALQSLLHHEHQLFIATARLDDVVGMRDWEGLKVWLVRQGELEAVDDLRDIQSRFGPGELERE